MRLSFLLPILAPALLAVAQPATAALVVSGDTAVLSAVDDYPANAQFFRNMLGDKLVLLHPGQNAGITTSRLSSLLNDAGRSFFTIGYDDPITPEYLANASLYVSYLNSTGWTAEEALILRNFVRGGGHVLLTGENYLFGEANAAVNQLVAAMGSDMQIHDDALGGDWPGSVALILEDNAMTAGTEGMRYIAASYVTGGTGLYGTPEAPLQIVAYDTLSGAVPEPSTWALTILGFGLVGGRLRRRRQQAGCIRQAAA
jgi:hypothetical protein